MNKKVLRVMLILVATFLVGLYVVKLFFPEQFVMVIENEHLVAIGSYIDNHWWLQEICDVITSFIVYWLYLCALTKRWYLNWKQILVVLGTIAVTHGLYYLDPVLCGGVSVVAMIIVPALFKAESKDIAIVFSIHYMAQLLSTLIRGLPLLLTDVNFITITLMGIESYFWLLLLYLYYNYRRNKNGKELSTTLQGS